MSFVALSFSLSLKLDTRLRWSLISEDITWPLLEEGSRHIVSNILHPYPIMIGSDAIY